MVECYFLEKKKNYNYWTVDDELTSGGPDRMLRFILDVLRQSTAVVLENFTVFLHDSDECKWDNK